MTPKRGWEKLDWDDESPILPVIHFPLNSNSSLKNWQMKKPNGQQLKLQKDKIAPIKITQRNDLTGTLPTTLWSSQTRCNHCRISWSGTMPFQLPELSLPPPAKDEIVKTYSFPQIKWIVKTNGFQFCLCTQHEAPFNTTRVICMNKLKKTREEQQVMKEFL